MYLSFLVFTAGAAVMALEIVSSRFFAPYIGTSIFVWTSLIGIVMAGLSIGYAFGGYVSDRWKSMERLQCIIAAAGLWTLFIAIIRDPLLFWLTLHIQSVFTVTTIGTTVLLLIPSILLGTVTPYAVRLTAHDLQHVGRTAGTLSALSTLGSILGTFLAGFALIPSLGTTTILFTIGTTLIGAALLRPMRLSALLGISLLLLLPLSVTTEGKIKKNIHRSQGIIAELDTPYSVVRVRELQLKETHEPFRLLQIDSGFHAAQYLTKDDHFFPYTEYFRVLDLIRSDATQALLIGGGAYTAAKDFLSRHPRGSIDVVEIDPVITEVARTYFAIPESHRLHIFHEDGRTFLNRQGPPGTPFLQQGTYHVVFGDAFQSTIQIPFHLTTKEAAERIASLLDETGLYLVNIIGALEGKRSAFAFAEIRTLKAVFPSVLIFDVEPEKPLTVERNLMLLASKAPLSPEDLETNDQSLLKLLAHRIEEPAGVESALILTDNYAPVEALVHL